MNQNDVLRLFSELLGALHLAPEFLSEFVSLITKSGKESVVFRLLVARIAALSSMGVMVTVLKEFEPLGDGIYSFHLTGNGFNYRILFGFLPNRKPVFLFPFYERGGKRKTDYSGKIDIAKNRLERELKRYESENSRA